MALSWQNVFPRFALLFIHNIYTTAANL
jgi:hypothetical protein